MSIGGKNGKLTGTIIFWPTGTLPPAATGAAATTTTSSSSASGAAGSAAAAATGPPLFLWEIYKYEENPSAI